ncbi:MAG: hypothetical protein Q6K90_02230, partial [Gloeomargarita sp. HHBFW_bins_162]
QVGELTLALYDELQRLQPYGMDNPAPQFWSRRVRILEQQVIGREQNHAKLTVADETGQKKVLAWGWGNYLPLPDCLDIAYTLRPNEFQGQTSLELQLVGVRYPLPELEIKPPPPITQIPACLPLDNPMQLLSQHTDKKWLLYGYQRPEFSHYAHVDYDRPQGRYAGMILWTLPPDPIYLRWLVALAQPQTLYVHPAVPPLPTVPQIHQWLAQALSQSNGTPWNLLALGQRYWVNPQVLVAGLRELGYDAPTWPDTRSVQAELATLATWYRTPAVELAQYLVVG